MHTVFPTSNVVVASTRKVEQLARCRIDPMQVLKEHQYRLPPRQCLELPQQRRQCPLLLALRAELERREALTAGKRL